MSTSTILPDVHTPGKTRLAPFVPVAPGSRKVPGPGRSRRWAIIGVDSKSGENKEGSFKREDWLLKFALYM